METAAAAVCRCRTVSCSVEVDRHRIHTGRRVMSVDRIMREQIRRELAVSQQEAMMGSPKQEYFLVSSYTMKLGHVGSKSCPHNNGITCFRRMPPADGNGFGDLTIVEQIDAGSNPTYLCVNADHSRVYVVNEAYAGGNEAGNTLRAYAFEKGKMRFLNSTEIGERTQNTVLLAFQQL